MTSIYSGLGYHYQDERCSHGGVIEHDLFGCTHCQALIRANDWREQGGWCGRCSAPICLACAEKMDTDGCMPFAKKIEALLSSEYRRRQNMMVLGI